jgi:hypothetical protein
MEKETLSQIFNIIETKNDQVQVNSIDFITDYDNNIMYPDFLSKTYNLNEEFISWEDIYSKTLDIIRNNQKVYSVYDHLFKPKFVFNINDEKSIKKLHLLINVSSNIISTEGRMGNPTFILMNSDIKNVLENFNYNLIIENIFVDNNLKNEIIIGRKNNIDMAGIQIFTNNVSYNIAEIGEKSPYQYFVLNY